MRGGKTERNAARGIAAGTAHCYNQRNVRRAYIPKTEEKPMRRFAANAKNKLFSKKGQGMIEYVIIMALIVIAAIVVLKKLSGSLSAKFNYVSTQLDSTGK